MHHSKKILLSTLMALTALPAGAGVLLFPNADFESGNLTNWTASGAAFTRQPTRGDNTLVRGSASARQQGNYWIGTYDNYDGVSGNPGDTRGDTAVGTLTSQDFTISKRYITFRIGGGNLAGQTGVKLVCEGQEHVMSSGFNSETMSLVSYDAAALAGKVAKIVIFDQATGGWGHINADEFTATDDPAPPYDGNFLYTPGIPTADNPAVPYDQPSRPQFHFSSRTGWLNDPNGMVFDGEKYHLFYQHNPLGTGWGNMTWGHAVSSDMVHWQQLDHALLPYQVDGRAGTIFSGTAVVDHNNSLGVQVGNRKTLVAFFTYASEPFYQAMAYSTDGGTTWQYYNKGRAVVPNQGFDSGERDPKVFWHEASQRWVMVLWVQSSPGRVRFFTSTNLKDWTFASDLMRDWAFECMDLFFLPVDGNPANTKVVIADASYDYEIGSFDGTTFHTEAGPFHAGQGNFYAAQTFNQAAAGRVVQIGWMSGGPDSAATYGLPFNQQMSFPCDLTLRTTPDGVRLCAWPVPEIGTLTGSTHEVTGQPLTESSNLFSGMGNLDLVDLSIEFAPGTATQVVIDLPRTSVIYDVASGTLSHSGADGSRPATVDGPIQPRNGKVSLRLLLDRLSLEAYVFGGERFGSHYIRPDGGAAVPSLRAVGGQAWVYSLSVKSLVSSWPAEPSLSTTLTNPGFEQGIPSGGTFTSVIPGWSGFGGWAGATGLLDDTGDALAQAVGYPDFTGAGAAALKARNGTSEDNAGIFQSLGHVGSGDVGKTFTLGADLGARILDGAGNYVYSGDLTVSFRKAVTAGIPGSKGTLLGAAGVRNVTADDADLPALANVVPVRKTATFTPTLADLGTEVFAVIDLHNVSSSASATAGEKLYLADRVTLEAAVVPFPGGLLAYEGFDYDAGSANLAGKDGGTGWGAAWQTVDNGGANVVAGSLVAGVAAPSGYDAKSNGNRSQLPNARRVGRLLDTSVNGDFGSRGFRDGNGHIGQDGKSVYISFLQQPSATGSFYEFEFHRGGLGDSGRIAGIGNDTNTNNVNLRAPNDTHTSLGAGSTAVNFYVVRIDFKAGNDDVYVYRNPTSATQPATATLTKLAVTDMSFDGISFGAFLSDRTVAHDEVRIGESWQDVVNPSVFPSITSQPRSATSYIGGNVTLTAKAAGNPVPTYQWFKGENPLGGQTGATLALTNVRLSDAGDYYLTATNSQGTATTEAARLTVRGVPADLLAYEGFDYPAQDNGLPGNAGGIGWSGGWASITGSGGSITGGNLVAATMAPPGYDPQSLGNSIFMPNNQRDGRSLDTTAGGPFGAAGYLDANGRIGKDGKTIYISFLQQPNGTTGFYEFELHRDNLGDAGRIGGIGNDLAGTNVNLRSAGIQTAVGPGNTGVNFYVVRIDFKAGNDDVRVYQNPVSGSEPEVASLSVPNAADMSFNGISLAAFNNTRTVAHDEIRVGRSWASVIAINPFESWAKGKGLDGSPGKEPAFDADPDGDSIPNGLEWILGGNPQAREAAPLVSVSSSTTEGITLTFTRAEGSISSTTLSAQWSTDLSGDWHEVVIDQNGGTYPGGVSVIVNGDTSPDAITVRIPAANASSGRLFTRLRATAP